MNNHKPPMIANGDRTIHEHGADGGMAQVALLHCFPHITVLPTAHCGAP